jgi:phosphate-selective porin OprO/OprP
MRTTPSLRKTVFAASAILAGATPLLADVRDDEIRELREQVQQLAQKLQALEQKEDARYASTPAASNAAGAAGSAGAAAKPQGKVIANSKGFAVESPDDSDVLRLRGLVQGDGRFFFGDHLSNNDAFLIRRARLIFEGKFDKIYEYQLVPEFGGTSGNGTLTILDANINIAPTPEYQVRVGRFREPVGLEQLQSDSWAFFAERSIVSQFVPNRDVGVQLGGDLLDKKLSYAIGVFDGVPDAANNSNNTDTNNDKDVAARVFATPFKGAKNALDGLGFGIAGSVGRQNSTNGATGSLTSGYKTDGQQTWFAYRSTATAQGETWRISPQADYYHGPIGAMAEYVVSTVHAANGANHQDLNNRAWQLSGSYVITGEDASYLGVVPKTNFSPADGTWGAFELVARVENARIDDNAFVGGANSLANPNTAAREATGYSAGLNWYLSKTVRASFDYFHTHFDLYNGAAPAATSPIYTDENAFLTRLQLIF